MQGLAAPKLLIIACGAIAREIQAVLHLNGMDRVKITQIAAVLHNHPQQITKAVAKRLEMYRAEYEHIFVAYADCGTGGELDKLLKQHGISRLKGSHCYEFFAGTERFTQLHKAEPGRFYVTDYLLKNFDRLIMQGMGLIKHPKLIPIIFGNYHELIYLQQDPAANLVADGRIAADRLGLGYQVINTGYGQLIDELQKAQEVIKWQH
jgi:hypothetical protein